MNMKTLLIVLIGSLFLTFQASAKEDWEKTDERITALEAQVAVLMDLLQYVSVRQDEIDGLAGPHFIIEGANVHIRSGSGVSWDDCWDGPLPDCMRGLGNLIVGYNFAVFDPETGYPVPCITLRMFSLVTDCFCFLP